MCDQQIYNSSAQRQHEFKLNSVEGGRNIFLSKMISVIIIIILL